MGWNPLLSGALRDSALDSATALTRTLIPAGTADGRGACLAAGSAGLAVCQAVAAQRCDHDQASQQAVASMDAAIDVLASQPLSLSLYSGFTGIAWAADLVDRLAPGEAGDRNDDIDLALAQALRRYPDEGPYDVIDGLAGLGIYALARWPRPAAVDCLAWVVEQLARRARGDAGGAYWWTSPAAMVGPRRQLYPSGGVDLGMAHGMAGVLPLLARACALGACDASVRALLDDAAAWFMAHLLRTPAGPTIPSFIADNAEPAQARSAWCYGDPGAAIALILAGRDTGEASWEQAGIELALTAARRPPEHTGVTEAGICHGAAGLAHLFNRMHQLTGLQELADAGVFWMQRTLEMCAAQAHPGQSTAARPWAGPGLLEGAAGIALVLLAGCEPAEPVWDQMLLVSTGLADMATAS